MQEPGQFSLMQLCLFTKNVQSLASPNIGTNHKRTVSWLTRCEAVSKQWTQKCTHLTFSRVTTCLQAAAMWLSHFLPMPLSVLSVLSVCAFCLTTPPDSQ